MKEWGAGDPIGSFMNAKKGGNAPQINRDLQNRQIIAEGAIARLLESKSKADQAGVSDYKVNAGDAMIVRTHYRKTDWERGLMAIGILTLLTALGGLFVGKWIMFAPFLSLAISFLFSNQFFYFKLARDNVAGEEVYSYVRAFLFPTRLEYVLLLGFFVAPLSVLSWFFFYHNHIVFDFLKKIIASTPEFFWQYLSTDQASFVVALLGFFIMFLFHLMQIKK